MGCRCTLGGRGTRGALGMAVSKRGDEEGTELAGRWGGGEHTSRGGGRFILN